MKSVLTSISIYYIMIVKAPKYILHALDHATRRFLWFGSDTVMGGKCKVNWNKVCRPTQHEGLAVLNLEKYVRTLKLASILQASKIKYFP